MNVSTSVEAYAILHTLNAHDIHAETFGIDLQSAVGQIAAHNNFRVMVSPDQYGEALALIQTYENKALNAERKEKQPKTNKRKTLLPPVEIAIIIVLTLILVFALGG